MADVYGPSSSTDNALTRFDTTTGKLVQNSTATLGDAGELTSVTAFNSGTSVTNSLPSRNCVLSTDGTSSIDSDCLATSVIASNTIALSNGSSYSVFKRNGVIAAESVTIDYNGTSGALMANNEFIACKTVTTFPSTLAGDGVFQCNLFTGPHGTGGHSISKNGTGYLTNNVLGGKANSIGGGTNTNVSGCFMHGLGNALGLGSSFTMENCVVLGYNNDIRAGKRLFIMGANNDVSGDHLDSAVFGGRCTVDQSGSLFMADGHATTTILSNPIWGNSWNARFQYGYYIFTGTTLAYGARMTGGGWDNIVPGPSMAACRTN
jgi:hypothetical protein